MHNKMAWIPVLLATMALGAAADTPPNRPNIVFILADDLGWSDTAAYGSKYYETPNIDRLAAQGLKLTNYHNCQCVEEDSNLRQTIKVSRVTACRNCRSATYAKITVEGFEPSTPCARGTCAAKLRHTVFIAPGGN